jgi:hypothetical protein
MLLQKVRKEVHTLHTILLLDLGGTLRSLGVGVVEESHVGAGLCKTLGNAKTDSSTSTGNDGSLALQREQTQQAGVRRWGAVVMVEETVGDGGRGHCEGTRVKDQK